MRRPPKTMLRCSHMVVSLSIIELKYIFVILSVEWQNVCIDAARARVCTSHTHTHTLLDFMYSIMQKWKNVFVDMFRRLHIATFDTVTFMQRLAEKVTVFSYVYKATCSVRTSHGGRLWTDALMFCHVMPFCVILRTICGKY